VSRQSITFTQPNDDWLQMQVDSQEYNTKTEVINDLIRKARQRQAEFEMIRMELIKAEESGFSDLSGIEIKEQAKQKLRNDGFP